ncbi:hypothetical protein M5D45_14655 [Cupriavidus campinensis]|uniref:Uncharacterized protein n=1 Tax=Cupriavidus campinensis TaxID=151783 RepID=A0AAE9I8J0_9BURK|nr:hypothetical protein M5D45_14655 [Cupriavidus campinensis]
MRIGQEVQAVPRQA